MSASPTRSSGTRCAATPASLLAVGHVPVFEHPPWVYVFVDDKTEDSPGYVRIREGDGNPGAAVLALREDAIALIEVYRRTLGRLVWEIPRGFAESGEASSQTARRELLEETGLEVDATALILLGRVAPNSGILEGEVDLYLAQISSGTPVDPLNRHEVAQVRWVSAAQTLDMVRDGQIVDGFTLSALAYALLRRVIVDEPSQPHE